MLAYKFLEYVLLMIRFCAAHSEISILEIQAMTRRLRIKRQRQVKGTEKDLERFEFCFRFLHILAFIANKTQFTLIQKVGL